MTRRRIVGENKTDAHKYNWLDRIFLGELQLLLT
jgi:hypothetical protein